MEKPRQSSYPMPLQEAEKLAGELSEFGYQDTDYSDEADRPRTPAERGAGSTRS